MWDLMLGSMWDIMFCNELNAWRRGRLLLVHELNKQLMKRDSMGDLQDLSEK